MSQADHSNIRSTQAYIESSDSVDELLYKFKTICEANRYNHDSAVLMGSLGILPREYKKFQEAIDQIESLSKSGTFNL